MQVTSKILIALIIICLISASTSWGLKVEKGQAKTILVKNKSAMMRYHKNYFITLASGAVGSEGIPSKINIGDVVRVKDRQLTVKYIFWTRYLERAVYGKEVLAEAGTISCVVVANIKDLPYVDEEEWRDRLWINVKDCQIQE